MESKLYLQGSGCGSVGRVVAFNSRGPQFEPRHRQIFIEHLFTVNCIVLKRRKWKKKRPGMANYLNYICRWLDLNRGSLGSEATTLSAHLSVTSSDDLDLLDQLYGLHQLASLYLWTASSPLDGMRCGRTKTSNRLHWQQVVFGPFVGWANVTFPRIWVGNSKPALKTWIFNF